MNARTAVLVRLFVRTVYALLEREGYDVSTIEFYANKWGCSHSNLWYDDNDRLVRSHHRFEVGLESMERLDNGRTTIEYPWIAYLVKVAGVNLNSSREKAKYIAFHEASHAIEQDHGGVTPSPHDELFETILFNLITEYWEVL